MTYSNDKLIPLEMITKKMAKNTIKKEYNNDNKYK